MVFGNKRREKVVIEVKPEVLADIRTLSEMTGFTVDEIACEALEQVLNDNKYKFVKLAVYEHFMNQLENANEEYEPFEMGGLHVEMYYINKQFKIKSIIKCENGFVKDEFTKVFENTFDEFENWLKYLGENIDIRCKDVEEYLSERMDYREIFRK